MKDVTEITDTDNTFTVYSPARNMTIEASTPVEFTTWLKALIETCPHADVSKVKSTNARYIGNACQAKPSDNRGSRDNSSKEHDLDYDEYRPLDKDTLLQLDSQKNGMASRDSQKSFDRSISLFSRNADGDKNSFYFASSGQNHTQTTSSSMGGKGNTKGQACSDTDDFDEDNQRLMSEGETLDQLGGMHRGHRRGSSGGSIGGGSIGGSAGGAPRTERGPRDSSRERDRDQSREDHRVAGRPTGGYGGGDASTTSRLHRHITRDTPPRAKIGSSGARRGGGGDTGDDGNGGGGADKPFQNDTGATGSINNFGAGGAGGSSIDDDIFNSSSSLHAHRGSPSPTRTVGGGSTGADYRSGAGDDSNLSPSHGIEVTSLAQDPERAARAKATLRERQRRKKAQNASYDENDSNSDNGDFPGSANSRRHRGVSVSGGGSSSDSSAADYGRTSRTVNNSSSAAAARRRTASRDVYDTADDNGTGGGGGGGGGGSTSSSKVGSPNRPTDGGGGGGGGSGRFSSQRQAQATSAAPPPRRAKDALLQEALLEGGATGGKRANVLLIFFLLIYSVCTC